MNAVSLDALVSLCKRRGFIFQGSEIYGGLAGTWDYGPLGTQLKRNIANLWWKTFVEDRQDMYGLDSAILMNQKVWQASGHVDTFTDPLVECRNCHERFRADTLQGDSCPNCGKKDTFTTPTNFNLMFQTFVGPTGLKSEAAGNKLKIEAEAQNQVYLRPETAQGMFTNFKNIVDSISPDLPFGIAQIGKAFRNEISPRDFTFRAREFEIMELEYFIAAPDWEKQFAYWRDQFYQWFEALGLPKSHIHELEVPQSDRAHYSKRTVDFEFDFPFGKSELYGLAYRTDFDLTNHQKHSGNSLEYQPKDGSKAFIPHVIEPTFGLDRSVLAVLSAAYSEDEQAGEKRIFLKLPTVIAPVKIAVFPLLRNKPELVTKAKEVYDALKPIFGAVMWDDNGNIGKRYRRQDEIGTPYCVTVDFDSLNDQAVTIRERDSMAQDRIAITDLSKVLTQKLKPTD